MSANTILRSTLVAASLLLPACNKAEPLPSDKADYAGQWRGDGMELFITAEGSCAYKRVSANATTEVNGPIHHFDGDDFVVKVLIFETEFDVTTPPTKTADGWTMTVDGVALTRVSP